MRTEWNVAFVLFTKPILIGQVLIKTPILQLFMLLIELNYE